MYLCKIHFVLGRGWAGGFPKTNNIQIVKQITIFLYLPLLTQLLYTGILNVCVYNNCPVWLGFLLIFIGICVCARFIIHNLQQTKAKHHFCSTYFQCFFGNIVYFRFEGWGEVCVCISDQELVLWLKERTKFTEAYYCNFPASWAHCVACGKYIFQENQLAALIPRKLTPAMVSACRESKYFWTGSKKKMY